MTRQHPFDPSELDRPTDDVTPIARELEALASAGSVAPPPDLAARVQDRIAAEPDRAGGWLAGLFGGGLRTNMFATAAVAVVAIVGAIALGQLAATVRQLDVGSTPSPSLQLPSPLQTPIVTPTPSVTPSASPSGSPSASPTSSPEPSPSATDEVETPEPSEDDDDSGRGRGRGRGGDEDETPEPSDDDSGSGSGDSSGPGGGG